MDRRQINTIIQPENAVMFTRRIQSSDAAPKLTHLLTLMVL